MVGTIDLSASLTLKFAGNIGSEVFGVALFGAGALGLSLGEKLATGEKSAEGPAVIASNICVAVSIVGGYGIGKAAGCAGGGLRNVSGVGGGMGRRLPGTTVDDVGDVMLYAGRQNARASSIVNEAAHALGIDLSNYVDDVVVISNNIHGDAITPWFNIVNGRRTVALTVGTLSRSRAGQLIDAAHEINHARHSQLLGASRYNAMYSDPLMQARIEVLVQGRAICAVKRYLGSINNRVLEAERGYIDNWSMVFFEELFR